MTDEITTQFEAFSEMLDQEENLESATSEDAQLLLQLRDVLRSETESTQLPSDFAQETAKVVRERYGSLSPLQRLLSESRNHLLSHAFGTGNLGKSAALVMAGAGVAYLDWKWLAVYGTLLGLLSGLWFLRERSLDDSLKLWDGVKIDSPTKFVANLLFYTLPVMAVLATGVLAALSISALSMMTLTFRDSTGTLAGFTAVVGIGSVVLLLKALSPVWRAYRARAASHLAGLAAFQTFHAVWLAALGFVGTAVLVKLPSGKMWPHLNLGLAALAIFCCFAVTVVHRSSLVPQELPSLSQARKVFLSSLFWGFGPILLTLVAFYQIHLTREIVDPSYAYILRDGNAWIKGQKAILPEQNGWIELRPYFVRGEQELPENRHVAQAFKALSEFYLEGPDSYAQMKPDQRASFESKKKEFLTVLPRIESALQKSYFSHIATEGFSYESLAPNFITYRAISQGLALLRQEAMAQGEIDQAIDYTDLALRWAGKEEPGSLIELMIKVAQLAIIYEGLEQMVLSGQLDDEQLQRLSNSLNWARLQRHVFSDTMKRETVMTDQALQKFLIDKNATPQELDNLGIPGMFAYLPKSFWESERKAYWNHQLSRTLNWHDLSYQSGDQSLELNPLNVASASLVPNIQRAQAQFCYLDSKYSSLVLQCQLERYRLKHDQYPPKLENLVPEFLSELPIDTMDPKPWNRKGGFQYKPTTQGYLLLSDSPMYEHVTLNASQSYGHDGNFKERKPWQK